jgi:hypothetical protein
MVGYVDDYTRLLYIGVDVNNAQFITEFALAKIVQDDDKAWRFKKDEESFAYQIEGQLRRIPSLPDYRDRRRRERLWKIRKDHCHAKESGPGWTLP